MTPMLFYTKQQWRFLRFTTFYDKQQTSWQTSTLAFYTTSGKRIPLSANTSNNYHHHQHTPSTYPLQPLPATLHHPDHAFAHHHHHPPTTPTTHLLLPLHQSHHRLASANNHHHRHSTHMQTGMPGTVTPIVASWSSKATQNFDPIGSLLPDGSESDTPLSSAKLGGKSSKIYRDYIQDKKPPDSTPPDTDPAKVTPPPQPLPSIPDHISPTPTSPANTPPPPSQADFSPSPTTTPRSTHEASPHEALPLQPAAERAPSENRHPEPFLTRLLAAISFDQFHPLSQACHRINSPAFSFEVRISRM